MRPRAAAGRRRAIPPYGAHDAGGFRNVLPPGQAGTDNVAQLARSRRRGTTRRTGWTSNPSTTA